MKNRKFVLSLVLLLCACLIGAFFFKDLLLTQISGNRRGITEAESPYNADVEIARALEQLKNSQEKASIIPQSRNGQRYIAITFDGLADRAIVQQLLGLLERYNAKATFFVEGIRAAEDSETAVNIKKMGQKLENYTLSGRTKMETMPVESLVKDFSRAQKIIQVATDIAPSLLKCNDTEYSVQLLQAAKASGFKDVVKSSVFFTKKQINSPKAADSFVARIKPGSIVSIKLTTNIEPIVNEKGVIEAKPAIDKQPGLKQLPQPAGLEDKELIDAVEMLLLALRRANYTTTYVENFSQKTGNQEPGKATLLENCLSICTVDGATSFLIRTTAFIQEQITALLSFKTAFAAETADKHAPEIKMIFTTEPALSYTFGGMSNKTAVDDVLERLKSLGVTATFFVTETEMKKYPETVRRIISNGHELGIAIRPKDNEPFEETRKIIIRCRKTLLEQFGVTTNLIKQISGAVSDTTKEVVSSLGCNLIGQSMNVVQIKHKDYTSAEQIMAEIFRKSMFSLARGQIIHFRMDYYTNDRLIGDLMETIKQRKIDNIAYATSFDNPIGNPANDSQYTIKPVSEVLNNAKFIYQYPIDLKKVPEHVRNDGHGLNIDQHNFLSEVSKRYIGNEYVNGKDRMLGFSKMDIRRLDKSGYIHTDEKVIFLTFDDWGTDAAINKLLYVLRKHNVRGSFFVLTNNVLNNPNLLRTIALQGHELGSHSDKHKAMAVRDPKTGKQVGTQDKEEYAKDLAAAYQKLLTVTGDVTVNGKPALTRFFRPPTLAISKMGFELLFEAGYEYIICGSRSTEDYKAESVPQLVRTFKDAIYTDNGEVKKGAVLVMHMGDSVVYTAMALDILLTANEAKSASDPTKFTVGSLSDYLPEGYSQIDRKKSLLVNHHEDIAKK